MFTMNVLMRSACGLVDSHPSFSLRAYPGRKYSCLFFTRNDLHAHQFSGFVLQVKAFSLRKDEKRARNGKASKTRTLQSVKIPSRNSEDTPGNIQKVDCDVDISVEPFNGKQGEDSPIIPATRSSVLQACITTSGLLLAVGALIRQASHVASMQGWAIVDASTKVSFGFETWHIELIGGLVLLITSCRFMLLKTWPDFAESSEAANRQELLFRGALLPLFGLTWTSALVFGAVFGALHLGSGRRYSFAVWASFVGFIYGLATIISSSMIVPMVAHSLNNLAGGILWSYTAKSPEKSR